MPNRQDRIRIGLLLPSSNTTQEAEFTRILPETVSLHVTRLPLRNVDPASTARIVEDVETESQKLADADVDAIVLAATAPSSRNGIGYDQELIRRIESASGRKATTASTASTASTALIQALTKLELQRLVIAGPWSEATNISAAKFIEASGFTILAHRALGHVSNLDIGLLDAQTAYDLGKSTDRPDAQAVMLACGNWLTLGIVDQLEAAMGKPVLTTNQVSLWSVLRLAGHHRPIQGWGRLLTHHMDAS